MIIDYNAHNGIIELTKQKSIFEQMIWGEY